MSNVLQGLIDWAPKSNLTIHIYLYRVNIITYLNFKVIVSSTWLWTRYTVIWHTLILSNTHNLLFFFFIFICFLLYIHNVSENCFLHMYMHLDIRVYITSGVTTADSHEIYVSLHYIWFSCLAMYVVLFCNIK